MDTKTIKAVGFGLTRSEVAFDKLSVARPQLGENSLLVKMLRSGICHSDVHTALGHWGDVKYPIIPGHEGLGRVIEKGKAVTDFEVGDLVGIGCMIDSCGECYSCKTNREQDCEKVVLTYNSVDWKNNNFRTHGTYSSKYVINSKFAIHVPENADLDRTPSLMCAGITVFSPIRQANVKEGDTVAVLGLGGLGHMAVKMLQELGCTVIAMDLHDKEEFARKLNVPFVRINYSEELDKSYHKKFDFVISTIPYQYDINYYLPMMKYNGTFAIVGLPPYDECSSVSIKDLILKYPNVRIMGSQIGGIEETQLCVDFCIAANIYPEVTKINADAESLNQAYLDLLNGNVDGRYVINLEGIEDGSVKEEVASDGSEEESSMEQAQDIYAKEKEILHRQPTYEVIQTLEGNTPTTPEHNTNPELPDTDDEYDIIETVGYYSTGGQLNN